MDARHCNSKMLKGSDLKIVKSSATKSGTQSRSKVPFSAETNTQRSYFVCDREAPEQKELAHELVEMLRGERGRHRDRDQRAIVVIWDVGGGKGGYCTCYFRQCFHFQLVFDFELLANWLVATTL